MGETNPHKGRYIYTLFDVSTLMKPTNIFDHETAARLINGNPVKRDDIKRFVSEASQTFTDLQRVETTILELRVEKERLLREVQLWKDMVLKSICE